jgi:hypothetical protein
LGKFMLKDAQLIFRSVADLEYVEGATTPCGLWQINQEDEASLDRFEGIKGGVYFKSEEITLNYAGRKRHALIYLMRSEAVYPPSQAYVNTIRKGYQDFGLDEKFLDDAIARSFERKAPDLGIAERRMRQRQGETHRELVAMPEEVAAKLAAQEGT